MEKVEGQRYWSASDVLRYSYCPVNFLLSLQGVRVDDPRGEEFEREVRGEVDGRARLSVAERGLGILLASFLVLTASLVSAFYISFFFLSTGLYFALGAGAVALSLALALKKTLPPKSPWLLYPLLYLLSLQAALLLATAFSSYLKIIIIADSVALVNDGILLLYILFRSGLQKLAWVPGEVVYRDGPGAPLLQSREFRVKGRPDYVVFRDGAYIPVEIKSSDSRGKIPFSHLMQLVAYSVMVEEYYGVPVSEAVLRYRDGVQTVEIDGHLKSLLRSVVSSMDRIALQGRARRNHSVASKCARCYRRAYCPQSLV